MKSKKPSSPKKPVIKFHLVKLEKALAFQLLFVDVGILRDCYGVRSDASYDIGSLDFDLTVPASATVDLPLYHDFASEHLIDTSYFDNNYDRDTAYNVVLDSISKWANQSTGETVKGPELQMFTF